jgi:hypothetical protein
MLVLLSDIVLLAQVYKVDNRLGGQKEERVDELDLGILSAIVMNYIIQKKYVISE